MIRRAGAIGAIDRNAGRVPQAGARIELTSCGSFHLVSFPR